MLTVSQDSAAFAAGNPMHRIASSVGFVGQLEVLIRTLSAEPKNMGTNADFPKIMVAIHPTPAAGQNGDAVDP